MKMFPIVCILWKQPFLLFLPILASSAANNWQNLYSNKLDITDGIRPFEECYVHLIQAHFEPLQAPNHSYDGSYDLGPLHFPVVLNQYEYRIHKPPPWLQWTDVDIFRPCILLRSNLSENSWLKFSKSYPQQKRRQQCKVILYVDSPVCDGLPIRKSPPGFTFILHNDLEFGKGESGLRRTFHANEFIVHVGQKQNKLLSFWLECWYSGETTQAKNYPVMIFLEIVKQKETNALAESAIFWTCPNYVTFHHLAKKCPQGTSIFREVECRLQYRDYLFNEHTLVSTNNVKSWQDLTDKRTSIQCESFLIVAAGLNDLPRKTSKVEYLLDWSDQVGTVAQIFLRILFPNITYTNEDEFLFPEKFHGLKRKRPEGEMYDHLQVHRLAIRPIILDFTVVGFSSIQAELFYQSTLNDQVRFVMCSLESHRGRLSFLGFVSAYKWEVWVVLAWAVLASCLIFPIASCKTSGPKFIKSCKIAEEIWSILLTQGSSKLRTNKWFYGCWTIAGLVLTNAYLGDNINKLTAPIPILSLDTFSQILEHNLTVYSPTVWLAAFSTSIPSANLNFTEDSYQLGDLVKMSLTNSETIFSTAYQKNNFKENRENVKERLRRISSNFSWDFIKPEYYLSVVSHCKSEPYVDVWSKVVKVKLQLLQKIANGSVPATPENVVVSKESYGSIYHNFQIGGLRISSTGVLKKFRSLMHSGIEKLFLNWQARIESWNDTVRLARVSDDELYKPAKINGNIRVVFFVHLILVSLGIIAFLAELWKGDPLIIQLIYDDLKNILAAICRKILKFIRLQNLRK